MGWELSASAAPCAQVSSAAQTALETLSGVNSAFYPAISSYPSTGFRNGQANIFPSLPSLNKVSSYTLDTMANPAQNVRHHGKMYPLLEWKRWHRRSMKKVSGIQVARIPWSLFTAMAYSNTASNGVLARNPHLITFSFSDIVYFHPVLFAPRRRSHLMSLTIFIWIQWNARLRLSVFCRSFNGSQIIQLRHLFLLVFTIHHWPAH